MANFVIPPVIMGVWADALVRVCVVLVIMDVIFGSLRAIRERKFNSSVGINGMIRKAGMLVSLICLALIDDIIHIDLIGFVPDAIKASLPSPTVGCMEFFAIIYIVYEMLSVMKNMALSGLPVSQIWDKLKVFLRNNTAEIADLPDDDEEAKNDGN